MGRKSKKEEIVVKTLGFNQSCFAQLVDLFNARNSDGDTISIHQYSSSNKGWEQVCTLPRRDIATFCMNEKQKQDILTKLTRFMERRDWYYSKGLTYKTSFMFYGPPGTGKTSLSKLLACHFKRDLYIMDLSDLTNSSLADALAKIKPGSFLLMEDIDQAGGAVRSRDIKNKKDVKMPDILPLSFLTMSGLLNAFDGVVSLDNIVVLMTTNKPEDIDAAVRRKSRIDYEYLIDYLGKDEVFAYMRQMYGMDDLNTMLMMATKSARSGVGINLDALRIAGCEMENIFKEYPDDPQAFLDEVFARHVGLKLVA